MQSDRRQFLASLFSVTLAGRIVAAPRFSSDPFTLGVASGDPASDGMVLWTRLAPQPLEGGGMSNETVEVQWEVASDEKMSRVVKRGKTVASPDLGHSVHVEVKGLDPARWYFYRFRAGDAQSNVGRTRTAPAANSNPSRLNFAFASCQNYEQGLYTAYDHMCAEDIELVVFLGDYIYEGPGRTDRVRRHNGGNEIASLADYRNRYGLYKSEPKLRKAHEQFPWIVTWDDHEVDNNYAGDIPEDKQTREQFLERRANAYQAFYEHMPIRRSTMPKGSRMTLYRSLPYGKLASFFVLDTRQYRTDQPCGDGDKPVCPAVTDANGTMLGTDQERWLVGGLGRSRAAWNVLAQQVMMTRTDRMAGAGEVFPMDHWNGYEVARRRLFEFLDKRKPSNPVVITGDVHSNWAADLKLDFARMESPTVGVEFTGTSISSGGDGVDQNPNVTRYLPDNPHIRFNNAQRGYVLCQVTPQLWKTDYRVLEYVTKPGSPVKTRSAFVVENGKPGLQTA